MPGEQNPQKNVSYYAVFNELLELLKPNYLLARSLVQILPQLLRPSFQYLTKIISFK